MIKKILIIWILLIVTYIGYSTFLYPYGLGISLFKEKLPNNLMPNFEYDYKERQGFNIYYDSFVKSDVIINYHPIRLENESDIILKKVLGYWYDDSYVIVKAKKIDGLEIFLKLDVENKNKPYDSRVLISDVYSPPKGMKYVNVDFSYRYLSTLRTIRNLLCFVIFILTIYLIVVLIKQWMKNKNA